AARRTELLDTRAQGELPAPGTRHNGARARRRKGGAPGGTGRDGRGSPGRRAGRAVRTRHQHLPPLFLEVGRLRRSRVMAAVEQPEAELRAPRADLVELD